MKPTKQLLEKYSQIYESGLFKPATDRQKAYMQERNIPFDKHISSEEASKLITAHQNKLDDFETDDRHPFDLD